MSAIDRPTVSEVARQRLSLAPADAPRLESLIDGALKSLAIKIARRTDWEALRKEINVACAAGVITLNDTSILTEVLLDTGELILNGKFAKPAPSYQELILKLPADVYRWSLRTPTKIYVTDLATGALGTVTQNGTLTCNFTPTLAELPDQYDSELISEVMSLAGGRPEPSAIPPMEANTSPSLNVNTG